MQTVIWLLYLQSTCIHGNNRYSSQVDLSVLRKGKRERDKGVKTGWLYIKIITQRPQNVNIMLRFFCFVVFPQFPYANYSREACWDTKLVSGYVDIWFCRTVHNTPLNNSVNSGFFQQLIILYIDHFRYSSVACNGCLFWVLRTEENHPVMVAEDFIHSWGSVNTCELMKINNSVIPMRTSTVRHGIRRWRQ